MVYNIMFIFYVENLIYIFGWFKVKRIYSYICEIFVNIFILFMKLLNYIIKLLLNYLNKFDVDRCNLCLKILVRYLIECW